ncbi:MAG: hypothetical protein OXI33_02010 [Chloroflexota bacterium]|nr:hypothetical protein [Chloroflexota bacterium]
MAEASPTVLAHVAWMLRGSFEDLSTEALAYILNRSGAARTAFRELLQQGGAHVSPVYEAQTQAVKEGGERPDLVGLDDEGKEHVLMEAKFDALLTENQPVNYLRYLPKDRNSALLVVAPHRRLEWLWAEMMQLIRAESDFTIGDERQDESVIGVPVGNGRTFILTSWDHLLGLLESRVQADGDEGTLRSIAELQGVVDYENLNAFHAPSGKLSDLDDDNKERLRKLVYGAIEDGRREGWADTTGYAPAHSVSGYVRYFKMYDVSMWFGYDTRLWECLGGPLWLGFQESAQECIGEVRNRLSAVRINRREDFYHDVPSWSQKRDFIRINLPRSGEFPELLESLLVQIREIASALREHEPCR